MNFVRLPLKVVLSEFVPYSGVSMVEEGSLICEFRGRSSKDRIRLHSIEDISNVGRK